MNEEFPTSLDTKETSQQERPPESYREFCRTHCRDEYQATLETYQESDIDHGTTRASTLDDCRKLAWFARNSDTGMLKVLSSTCKLRWCPMCAQSRRMHLTNEVSKWLGTIEKPKFLTLTLAHNDDPLDDQIDYLYDSFKSYRRLNLLKRAISGGVWFFQIHKAKSDDLWHPHLHCVIDSEYMDKYELSNAWEMITKTSKIINIKEVKDASSMAEYVARYAARPSILKNLEHWSRLELFESLHGRRLVGTWGNARVISLRPSKPPDSDKWKNIGYFDRVFWGKDTSETALKIWQCYKNNEPCPENCNYRDELSKKNTVQEINHKTVSDTYQMLLGFY